MTTAIASTRPTVPGSSPVQLATGRVMRAVRILSRPVLSLANEGDTARFTVESPMYDGKPQEGDDSMGVPTLLDVQDLDTTVPSLVVCPTVLVNELTEKYPDDSYVGRHFAVENMGKKKGKGGKSYSKISIVELEDDPATA